MARRRAPRRSDGRARARSAMRANNVARVPVVTQELARRRLDDDDDRQLDAGIADRGAQRLRHFGSRASRVKPHRHAPSRARRCAVAVVDAAAGHRDTRTASRTMVAWSYCEPKRGPPSTGVDAARLGVHRAQAGLGPSSMAARQARVRRGAHALVHEEELRLVDVAHEIERAVEHRRDRRRGSQLKGHSAPLRQIRRRRSGRAWRRARRPSARRRRDSRRGRAARRRGVAARSSSSEK